MGLVQRLLGAEDDAGARGPTDDFWYKAVGVATAAGLRLGPDTAMEVSAVFACVKVIAETLATLPLVLYHRIDATSKERAVDDSLYWLLHSRPNAYQTAFEFKETMSAWAVLHGSACAFKIFGSNGELQELDPIHPSLVKTERLPSRKLRFQVLQSDGTRKPYTQDEIFRIRGLSLDGVDGIAMSRQAREAIALARAMEAFGSRYFANDTTIGVTLEHPNKLSPEAHARLKESFAANHGGVNNAFRPKILEEGMKLNRIQANGKEAQLTEGRLHQVIEICRFFRMPPHKIAHLIQATFSNIEHQALEFVSDTMMPWAARWEQAITRDLIVDEREYVAEFLMLALLRGDAAARATYYKERFNMGSISPNEIRALENENPVPGGDRRYVNSATVPLDEEGVPVPSSPPSAPNPEPAGGASAPDPADDTTDATASAHLAFAVLVADASERISRAETREIEKRADKATEDAVRFVGWAREVYAVHQGYVVRAVAPLAQAWQLAGGRAIDVQALAAELCAQGLAAVSAENFTSSFAAWRDARQAEIAAALTAHLQLETPRTAAA